MADEVDIKHVTEDPRIMAAIDLIGHTGAKTFQFRFSDDEQPVVWFAIGEWDERGFEVGASLNPVQAIFRLLDEVIDGGECQHCHRPTGFEPSTDPMPLDEFVCWYQWDPELKVFRRGCAGDLSSRIGYNPSRRFDALRQPTSPLDI